MTEKGKEGVGFGFPASYDFGVELAPTFPQVLQGLLGFFLGFCPIDFLEIFGQCFSILLSGFVERIAHGVQDAELPVCLWEDLPDRFLQSWEIVGDEDSYLLDPAFV